MPNEIKRSKLTTDAVFNALKTGYRHLDLAANYHNLKAVAAALKKAFLSKAKGGLGLKREDLWLTMKADCINENHIDALLTEVGVKYFDLFLIHHPTALDFQSEQGLEKDWRELANINKSKLKRIGVSNFYEPHLMRLLTLCDRASLEKPYANQVELNLLSKNQSLMDYCHSHGIKVIAYSPLGYVNSPGLLQNANLNALAKKMRTTSAQAALAWLMEKGIAVIPKTTHLKRLKENFQATSFIKAVKQNQVLKSALDKEPDLIADGLTQTAVDSKAHGDSLTWDPASTKKKGWMCAII